MIVAFTVPSFPGAFCPTGGSAACANQHDLNLVDPAVPGPSYVAGFAAFDGKGLFRGFVDKVQTSNLTATMVYRDPDASGLTGVAGAGSDGPLRWGAWSGGAYRPGGAINTATLVGVDSHFVIGKPVTQSLGSTAVAYDPIPGSASKALQMNDLNTGGAPKLVARGVLEAFSIDWNEGSLSGTTLTGNVSMTVRLASGVSFTGSGTILAARRAIAFGFEPLSGTSPGQATIFASLGLTPSDGTSCTSLAADGNTVTSTTCPTSIRIGLAGNPATHGVLSYSISLPRLPGNIGPDHAIRGNAALKKR